MKTFKKSISIILAALMLISVFSIPAFAAEVKTAQCGEKMKDPDASGTIGDNCVWRFYESTGEMYITGNGAMDGDVYNSYLKTYRSKIKYVLFSGSVTSVADAAFQNCANLQIVALESSAITEIGTNAFYGCTSLTGAYLPDCLKTIGDCAFMNTALKTIEVPDSVANFGNRCLGYVNASTKVEGFEIEGCNGSPAYDYAKANDFKFTPATEDDDVTMLSLSATLPKDGEAPDKNVKAYGLFEDAPEEYYELEMLDVEYAGWTDVETGSELSSSDTFEKGKKYKLEVYLKAGSGYKFKLDEEGNYELTRVLLNTKINVTSKANANKIEDCDPSKYMALSLEVEATGELEPEPAFETVMVTFDINGASIAPDADMPVELRERYEKDGKVAEELPKGTSMKVTFDMKEIIPPEGKVFDYIELNGEEYDEEYYNAETDTVIKIIWKDAPAPYPKDVDLSSGKLKLNEADFADVRYCFRRAELYGDIEGDENGYDIDCNGKADVVIDAAAEGGPFVKRADTCNLKGKYTFDISNSDFTKLTVNFGTPKISAKTASLNAGAAKTLKVTSASVVKWSTSDKKTVTVKDGKITALKKGKAKISALLATGDTLNCSVTVKNNPKLSKKSITVKAGKTKKVKITGKAAGVNNKYTNTKKAKITSKTSASTLTVKGLKKGNSTLKIKVNGVTLKLKVKVK